MTEPELQQYLLREYPQENARCEWKEFKNLKNSFRGDEKDDVISYVSAIANMEGGFLVVGVHDKTLEIVGTNTYNFDRQKAILRLSETDAKNLLERGLIEGEYPDLTISLSIARQTRQLPEYTKVKGLERDKIKQMALQFIQNAGEEGTRREFVMEYLRESLPARNTKEQNQRLVGNILAEMSNEGLVLQKDRNWYATISKDKNND